MGISFLPVIIFSVVIGAVVQWTLRSRFAKYSKIGSVRGLTAAQVARDILDQNGLTEVAVEGVKGKLTDHYDPRSKTLRLSEPVFRSTSLAAIGIAAHEAGHAIQHGKAYAPFKARSTFVPVANLGSQLLMPAIIGAFFLHIPALIWVGVFAYSIAVVFSVVTLPVEFNASSRALSIISERGYLTADELGGARKVLSAAAMTYVAATLVAVMTLLAWIGLARD